MNAAQPTMSRRRLVQGVAAGAGTVALAGCRADHFVAGDVNAVRVPAVPIDDPDHQRWDRAPRLRVELGPQDMALPMRLDPTVGVLQVQALHDDDRIAFRLEWDDPDASDLTVRVDDFRDACAVMLVPGPATMDVRTMGNAATPATLLHWKADWQRDVDEGRQGIDTVYPNRSVDVYPPLWDVAPAEVDVDTYQEHDAGVWLPGVHVGNPISAAGRATPVEKAIAYGFSTTTTGTTQNVTGRGVRTETGWRVVIVKSLRAVDDGEVELRPGATAACAFAVWSGGAQDAGSRKSPSVGVYSIELEG